MGHGSTVAGGTEWESWDLGGEHISFIVGLQVEIDTRAAGFTEVPCYFAWLQGGLETRLDVGSEPLFLPLFVHLTAASLTSVRVRVLTVAPLDRFLTAGLVLSSARQHLTVCWLGIQMRSGDSALSEVIHGHA
jgi:hypothetical protein